MRHLAVLLVLLLVSCGGVRELSGESRMLSPEQIAWIERCVEDDFDGLGAGRGKRFVQGVIVARADGEVISCAPIMQAAKRGLVRAGATEVEGGEADLLIKGELNVNAMQDGLKTVQRYVLEMKLIDVPTKAVLYAQTYIVVNRHEQQRWK